MFKKLLEQFIIFSRENWWVFVVLLISIAFIFFTDSGDIVEILMVFFVYFCAELCMMLMISYMHSHDYKTASIFQLLWNTIFTFLFLYHYLQNGQMHYFLGSGVFILGTIKNFCLYHKSVYLSFINSYTIFLLWLISFGWYYSFHTSGLNTQVVMQSIGLITFSTYLVMQDTREREKYFVGLWGLIFLVFWSLFGVYYEYLSWEIFGITLAFVLMPLTVLIIYIKSIHKYI